MTIFTDQDIFITNTTSTYQDIPKDCKLVGAELDHPDSIYLKLTDSGPFWVGAPKGSKRNISPFGELLIIHTIGISCVITCLLLCYYIKCMCHSIVNCQLSSSLLLSTFGRNPILSMLDCAYKEEP
jgi:hypothetical protein